MASIPPLARAIHSCFWESAYKELCDSDATTVVVFRNKGQAGVWQYILVRETDGVYRITTHNDHLVERTRHIHIQPSRPAHIK